MFIKVVDYITKSFINKYQILDKHRQINTNNKQPPPWLSGIAQPWYVHNNKKAEVASSTLAGGFL